MNLVCLETSVALSQLASTVDQIKRDIVQIIQFLKCKVDRSILSVSHEFYRSKIQHLYYSIHRSDQ